MSGPETDGEEGGEIGPGVERERLPVDRAADLELRRHRMRPTFLGHRTYRRPRVGCRKRERPGPWNKVPALGGEVRKDRIMLSDADIDRYGDELHDAFLDRRTVPNLRDRVPGITIDDAYRIQSRFVDRRLKAGETIVGKKIGVTSAAVMNMLGVYEPDFGQLLSGMVYEDGATIPLSTLIQPRAEGEIGFVLKHDLTGPGITAVDVLRATDYLLPCFEIVDSRIDNWDIKIVDTVADNASCGVYVLGTERVDPYDVDLQLVGMTIEQDGELFTTGAGAAVQGSPVNAVVWLANTLGRLGIPFRAGEVILSGSLAAMAWVKGPSELTCSFGGLGSCSVTFA
jgi:2-oxopent-4-enoate/cis-2-oxohex-4-enoate hydratase